MMEKTVGRPPERIRVTLIRKRRGDEAEDPTEDLVWPKNWPIPEVGSVVVGHVLGGWVDHIEFVLDSERIWISMR